MDDENKEQPARRTQVEPGPEYAVAGLNESAPRGEDLGQREGNQDRDNDRVQFEVRDWLKLQCGLTDMVFSGRPRERSATVPNGLATGYQTI